jgi:hypothetical protein
MSKIFISYSHQDEEWKDKLIEHLNRQWSQVNYFFLPIFWEKG